MNQAPRESSDGAKQQRPVPTVSAVFDDGSILEMVYRPEEKRTAFVFWKNGEWKLDPSISVDTSQRLVPYWTDGPSKLDVAGSAPVARSKLSTTRGYSQSRRIEFCAGSVPEAVVACRDTQCAS